MAASWDPEVLSAILQSSLPGLDRASHDPAFPSLSSTDADDIRTTSPLSTEGRMLRIFQDLRVHSTSLHKAAEHLGPLVSRHCAVENAEAVLLWGAICHRAEIWPHNEIHTLCDLVVELAGLSYPLPAYPYHTDEPVQGTSSFLELPGFGHELISHMQGQSRDTILFRALELLTRSLRSEMLQPAFHDTRSTTKSIVSNITIYDGSHS